MIRDFVESDNIFLQKINMLNFLELTYHGDVIKDAVFTAVDEKDEVTGVLYFKYHFTWNGEKEAYHKIILCPVTDVPEVEEQLIVKAKEWFFSNRENFKEKNPALVIWEDSQKLSRLQMYMHQGFLEYDVYPCLEFDLTKEIPFFDIPKEMQIQTLPFEQEAIQQYVDASKIAYDGTPDSIHDMWFLTGEESYRVFMIMDGDIIVSTASIWRIEDNHGAIENIFCSPEYRNRDLARAVITYALQELKRQNFTSATLSMKGKNLPAHHLYHSLGFQLSFNQIELIFPL